MKYRLATIFFVTVLLPTAIGGELWFNNAQRLYYSKGNNGSIICDSTKYKAETKNGCIDYYITRNGTRLDKSLITTIGNHTIYNMTNLQKETVKYNCRCGIHDYWDFIVFVDDEELPKVNLKETDCTSYDFEYVECKFKPPSVESELFYNLSFDIDGVKGNVNCSMDIIVTCTLKPKERVLTHNFLNLTLTGKTLSNLMSTESIEYNNWIRMMPDLSKRTISTITNDSICIMVNMERISLYNYLNGLKWDVNVTPKNFDVLPKVNQYFEQNDTAGENLCFKKLPYAFYHYTISIKARVNKIRSQWTEIYEETVRTEPYIPTKAPAVTNGSFYIDKGSIHIYWVGLQRHEFNGPNITYDINEYHENGTIKSVHSRVKQPSLSMEHWDNRTRYDFEIRAHNDIGKGVEGSRLAIMPLSDYDYDTHKPNHVQGLDHGNSFTLSWEAPKTVTDKVLNYTIYWCNSYRKRQHNCIDSINFVNVPSTELNFTTEKLQNQSFQMSVSANFEHINTGMHWPICTRDINDDLSIIEPTHEDVTSHSFNVKWSTENICPVIFIEYNLTYCENSICEWKRINKFDKSYKIENLKPYTNYTVKICMYSMTKECKYGNGMTVLTREAAPTRPEQLEVIQKADTSVTLKWQRPSVTNGIIRDYIITITGNNDIWLPVDGSNDSSNSITYKYSGLKPYTAYKVFVRAYTQYYSEPSDSIHFNTTVGTPSKPDFNVTTRNEKTILNWERPSIPAGPVHYYEVAIREINGNGTVVREDTSYIQSRECHFVTPDCKPTHTFEYRVRAVNVELVSNELIDSQQNNSESESHYVEDSGNLKCVSDELESYNLQKKYRNSNMYLLYKSEWGTYPLWCSERTSHLEIFVLVSFFVIMSSVFAMHMARKKYNKMADIDLTLPSGMESLYTKPAIDIGSTGEDDGTNPGGFTQSPPSWKCTMSDGDRNLQMFIPQTQLETNCGNENSKLLFSAAATVNHGHVGLPYVDEPHGNDELNPGLSYTRMNSDSTTDTLIDNEHNVVTQGAPASQYKKASEFTGTRLVTPDPITADAKGMGMGDGGYIKPANMLDMWHPWDDVSHSNAVTHGNGSSAMNIPKAPNVPTGGYVTVQNLQTPNVQTQKPNLTAVPSMQPTHLSGAILSTNGYVQAADLQKLVPKTNLTNVVVNPIESKPLVNASGYTTMEHLANASRTNVTANAAVTTTPFKFPTCTNGEQVEAVYGMESAAKPISGYVTQQDLNILAKHHQQQHQVL